MKIFLTGASSYVGARLYLELNKKFDISGSYNGSKLSDKFIQLDVTNPYEVQTIIANGKPDVIIHAAANASASWCEANPEKALALNQQSTKSIVHVANEIEAKVIFISSFAAMDPVNVYGKTKLESEKIVKQTKKGYIILRPSLLFGYSPNTVNDRPFNRLLKNLDEKTEPRYDNSWKFQPTYLYHVAEIISTVLDNHIINEVIPVAVKELKTRYDVAKDILTPFGIQVIPNDKQDTSHVTFDNLEKLKELKLPQYSYQEIILKIVDEIKQRELYSSID